MILNGLGFTNDRLYLVPRFFQNKPVDRLIGPGIESEHLNYSVSRLNEPKGSYAKYKFDFSAKFILQWRNWSAKFILPLCSWSAKFILQWRNWSAKFILQWRNCN